VKIGGFVKSEWEDHRDIIDIYATKGYRFVGYMPTNIKVFGRFTEIDLIFEIET